MAPDLDIVLKPLITNSFALCDLRFKCCAQASDEQVVFFMATAFVSTLLQIGFSSSFS